MGRREQFSVGELTLVGVNKSSTLSNLIRDSYGYVAMCGGSSIPVDGGAGYAIGCEFIKSNAATGQCTRWFNHGTTTSCAFRPIGPVIGYGFNLAGGSVASAGGDTTEVITIPSIRSTDISLVNHAVSNDTDSIVSQITANTTITIVADADPSTAHGYYYGTVRQGCIPEWDLVAAGTHTTVGGSTAEAITVAGVLSTDLAFVCYSATNDTDTIVKVVPTTNTLTVTMSANPSTAHGIHYMVLRQRGSFKPSHYIAYAGVHTTVGGAAAEAITITGALATDIPIVYYSATDDTDTILKSVMTANTLTVTMSADPSTTHGLAYVILRAY